MGAVQQKLVYGSHFYGDRFGEILLFGAKTFGYHIASLSRGSQIGGQKKKMNPPRCAVGDITSHQCNTLIYGANCQNLNTCNLSLRCPKWP